MCVPTLRPLSGCSDACDSALAFDFRLDVVLLHLLLLVLFLMWILFGLWLGT